MDSYKLVWTAYQGTSKDITGYVAELQCTDAMEALSAELTFTFARNSNDKYLGVLPIHAGDRVQLFNNAAEIFRGIIREVSTDGTVTANDLGWYLGQSTIIMQANKLAASEVIKKVGAKAGVQIGKMPSIPTLITEIYANKTPAEIITAILEKATAERGTKYFCRVEGSALCIYEYPVTPIKPIYKPAENLAAFPITWRLGSVSGSENINDLRNTVTVYRDKDDTLRVLDTASDADSVAHYGLLQHVIQADDKMTSAQATQAAKATLKNLNQVAQDYTIESMFGADEVRCGVMLEFNSPGYIVGKFIVTEVTHTYYPTHTMTLEVKSI